MNAADDINKIYDTTL